MGAWPFIHLEFNEVPLKLIARPASGSTATGSSKFHFVRQRKIIEKTFEGGREALTYLNVPIVALVQITNMDNGKIEIAD